MPMSLPPPAPMKRTPMHCGDCCDWHCGLGALAGVPPKMTAYFNAVGQAHATLFELSCGAIMVDAGSQGDAHEQTLIDYRTGCSAVASRSSQPQFHPDQPQPHRSHTLAPWSTPFTVERLHQQWIRDWSGGFRTGLRGEVAA